MKHRRVCKKQQTIGTKEYVTYSIGIPAEIAVKIPVGMSFAAEFTEEGLLFRPVTKGKKSPVIKLPKWLK